MEMWGQRGLVIWNWWNVDDNNYKVGDLVQFTRKFDDGECHISKHSLGIVVSEEPKRSGRQPYCWVRVPQGHKIPVTFSMIEEVKCV